MVQERAYTPEGMWWFKALTVQRRSSGFKL